MRTILMPFFMLGTMTIAGHVVDQQWMHGVGQSTRSIWNHNFKSADLQTNSAGDQHGSLTVTALKVAGNGQHQRAEYQTASISPQDTVRGNIDPSNETVRDVNSEASHNLQSLVQHLTQSLKRIEAVPAYTAVMEQQVQKSGNLRDTDRIELKVRHSPFSVYLKWEDDGQEVLFVEGKNNGRLLAHATRGFSSLRRVWRLTPDSQQAMRDCRYPLTEIGIEKLTQMSLRFYRQKRLTPHQVTATQTRGLADGHPAVIFKVQFTDDQVSPDYASSQLTFEVETGLLVGVVNHAWGPSGQPGELLERYVYHGLDLGAELTENDFSEQNEQYHFSN